MNRSIRLTPTLLLIVLLGAAGACWCSTPAHAATAVDGAPAVTTPGAATAADTTAPARRVLAYYFHTTKRCVSCRKIEAYTAEAIQAGFADELKSGRLVFRTVNVDEKGNEHFMKDYQLFTKSVVLVDERSGKQAAFKNLPKIWELLNDKNAFQAYIRTETRTWLDGKAS